MKKRLIFAAIFPILAVMTLTILNSKAMASGNELVIADFNAGEKPNNIGGDFGAWDKDPEDDTQGTKLTFVSDDALGDPSGYAARLDYDVDSPSPAYNGFWMKLQSIDATPYNTLTFYAKGDVEKSYTKRIKIELKDGSEKPASYVVGNLTESWQKFSITFDKFRRIQDWNALKEFVLVFDDMTSRPKTGAVYIDQIALEKQ